MDRISIGSIVTAAFLVLGLLVGDALAQPGQPGGFGQQGQMGQNHGNFGQQGQMGQQGMSRPPMPPPELLNTMGFALGAEATGSTTGGLHVFSLQIVAGPGPRFARPVVNGGSGDQNTQGSDAASSFGDNGNGSSDSGATQKPVAGRALVAGTPYVLTDVQLEWIDAPRLDVAPRAEGESSQASSFPGGNGSKVIRSVTAKLAKLPSREPVAAAQTTSSDGSAGSSGVSTGSALESVGELSLTIEPLEGRAVALGKVTVREMSYTVHATIIHGLERNQGMAPGSSGSGQGQNGQSGFGQGMRPGSGFGGAGGGEAMNQF
ncbi:MAG: hypothetical protein HY815_29185 [Candidatus Riflebacteria bacterium]|nr:hypothetical protein [Candidatus Riflebacteria bacterium]